MSEPEAPRKLRVLLVDPLASSRVVTLTMLEEAGHEVVESTNGMNALQQIQADQFDLLITDIVMPDMDGNEVLLWLLQKGYSAGLIITTGYSPDYAQEAKTLAEFNGLQKVSTLTKPVRSIELRSVLTRDEPLGPDHRPAAV